MSSCLSCPPVPQAGASQDDPIPLPTPRQPPKPALPARASQRTTTAPFVPAISRPPPEGAHHGSHDPRQDRGGIPQPDRASANPGSAVGCQPRNGCATPMTALPSTMKGVTITTSRTRPTTTVVRQTESRTETTTELLQGAASRRATRPPSLLAPRLVGSATTIALTSAAP
jgi:hypothetical protein